MIKTTSVPAPTCRKCGTLLPRRAGPGRPRSYCSDGCARASEYERRRVDRALERVEQEIRTFGPIEPLETERRQLEARLRELLTGEEPEDTP